MNLDLFSEQEICQKLQLPDFLLTSEDFEMIRLPLMRNFIFKQDIKSSNLDSAQFIKPLDDYSENHGNNMQYLDTVDREDTDDFNP